MTSTNIISNIPKWCVMCDIRIPIHIGTFKCLTCNCWICNKHLCEMNQYDNRCPGCWCSNDGCILCQKNLTIISEEN